MPPVGIKVNSAGSKTLKHRPLTRAVAAKLGARVEGPPGMNKARFANTPGFDPSKVPRNHQPQPASVKHRRRVKI